MIGILFAEHRVILGVLQAAERREAMMKARATTSKKATKVQTARGRYDELKQILEERRREILAQVQRRCGT